MAASNRVSASFRRRNCSGRCVPMYTDRRQAPLAVRLDSHRPQESDSVDRYDLLSLIELQPGNVAFR